MLPLRRAVEPLRQRAHRAIDAGFQLCDKVLKARSGICSGYPFDSAACFHHAREPQVARRAAQLVRDRASLSTVL